MGYQRPSLFLFLFCIFSFSTGCTSGSRDLQFVSVKTRLGPQISQSKGTGSVSYVADFEDVSEAKRHKSQVESQGGKVETLDSEGRVQKVTLDSPKLDSIKIPEKTLLAVNSKVSVKIPHPPGPVSPEMLEGVAQTALAARKVVGVDELIQRFPEANGKGLKVAVFDTGIDLGVEGVFRDSKGQQKLVGFYDMTGFGKVVPTRLENETPQKTYTIEGRTLQFDESIAPLRIQSVGVLDPKVLAKSYYAPSVDLDGYEDESRTYVYAVGVNSEGAPAVWIDVDRDGKISSRANEELTNFNTTFKYTDLRTDVEPSGARPLAVSITSPTEIQFHQVSGGHGTSCGIIIAGDRYANGHVVGMAPQAQLVSYLLDETGQDVYSLDQLIRTFQHAKEQKVDAISISWGFSVGDLASARFLADYLDKEIASQGIVIGIAAGNEGPGISSGAAVDYIPHHGFGVGALISPDQARGVYGWTGIQEPSVVYYSSMGPTRGGRQIPDVVSPLMTWVRGERGVAGPQFYAFSGTSSATPALIGATTALVSALKQNGEEKIDTRILKLAILNSAKHLDKVELVRQGTGLIQVDKAYDLYKRLIQEVKKAQADPMKRTHFPFELRAKTQLVNTSEIGEGIHLHEFQPSAKIFVEMSAESSELLDSLTTLEPLFLTHKESFFEVPEVLPFQVGGINFQVKFDPNQLSREGIYSDVISVRRASDGLILLQIPVVVEIPVHAGSDRGSGTQLATVETEMKPFDVWRHSFKLFQNSAIEFEGILSQLRLGKGSTLLFSVYAENGVEVFKQGLGVQRSSQPFSMTTGHLPAGVYQVVLSRTFGRPAVLEDLHVSGSFHTPYAEAIEPKIQGNHVELVLLPREDLILSKVDLSLGGKILHLTLTRNNEGNQVGQSPAFVGDLDLGDQYPACGLALHQHRADTLVRPMQNMSLAILDKNGETLHRGWANLRREGSATEPVDLSHSTDSMHFVAYPNIMDWRDAAVKSVELDVSLPLSKPIEVSVLLNGAARVWPSMKAIPFQFSLPQEAKLPQGPEPIYGKITLYDAAGTALSSIPLKVTR